MTPQRKQELEERAQFIVDEMPFIFDTDAERMREIEWIRDSLIKVEREVWSSIIRQIDYRHCTVTMDQPTLKEWCMNKYKEIA